MSQQQFKLLTWYPIKGDEKFLFEHSRSANNEFLVFSAPPSQQRREEAQLGKYFVYDGKWVLSSSDRAQYETSVDEFTHFMIIPEPEETK